MISTRSPLYASHRFISFYLLSLMYVVYFRLFWWPFEAITPLSLYYSPCTVMFSSPNRTGILIFFLNPFSSTNRLSEIWITKNITIKMFGNLDKCFFKGTAVGRLQHSNSDDSHELIRVFYRHFIMVISFLRLPEMFTYEISFLIRSFLKLHVVFQSTETIRSLTLICQQMGSSFLSEHPSQKFSD